MHRLRFAGLALCLTLLGEIALPPALAQAAGETSRKAVERLPEWNVNSKALQGTVKLGAAFSKDISQLILPPDWEAELQAHNELRLRYNKWKNTYQQYMGLVNSCLAKDHTITDQQAAGCVASDTLAVCMDKIYNKCIDHSLRAHVTPGIPGLVDAAKALSEEASGLAKRIPNALPKPLELSRAQ